MIYRYLSQEELPDGEATKNKYLNKIDSAIVYTEGCCDIGQPGLVFLLGPNKGEMPISAEITIYRSKNIAEIAFNIAAFIAKGGPVPSPLDYVYDTTGRAYLVTNNDLLIKKVQEAMLSIDQNGGRDFQVDPIVFIPICNDDSLIFGHASTAVH